MISGRPLPGSVEHAQDTYLVNRSVVNQNVVFVNHQLSCASDATDPTQSGVINQIPDLLRKQLIERQRCPGVVCLNVVIDRAAVIERFGCPKKPHDLALSFCRVCSLRLANSASTSAADTRLPALAESNPT